MGATNLVIGVAAENTLKVGAYGALEAAAVDVGLTDGGVEIIKNEENKEIYVDQYLGPVDIVTIKEASSIKVNLAESSLANLALAMGQPVSAVDGGAFTLGGKSDLRDHRTAYINVKGPGPGTLKITIHKCKIKGDSSLKYTKDNVTMVPVELIAMEDTTKTAQERMMSFALTGADSTAPVVALSSPVDGDTVVKDAKTTVEWTFTEASALDENTIVYGDTVVILNITTPATATLVAGTLVYTASTKKMVFTPTANWTASDSLQAMVTTGVKDAAGNALAATKIEQFSVTA
jgi:hypothetical protein